MDKESQPSKVVVGDDGRILFETQPEKDEESDNE